MKNQESRLQIACVGWFRLQYPKRIIFAIPNGGKRNAITASILKAEGVLAGVPDLFIPEAANGHNGLFIEMKYDKNGLSDNQKKVIPMLEDRGYKVAVCKTFDAFCAEVSSYLTKYRE